MWNICNESNLLLSQLFQHYSIIILKLNIDFAYFILFIFIMSFAANIVHVGKGSTAYRKESDGLIMLWILTPVKTFVCFIGV